MVPERMMDEFRALSALWLKDGHGVLLRKICDLFREDDPKQLMDLMGEVDRSMPNRTVARFYETIREWVAGGGRLTAVLADPIFQSVEDEIGAVHRQTNAQLKSIDLSALASAFGLSESPAKLVPDSGVVVDTMELSATESVTVSEGLSSTTTSAVEPSPLPESVGLRTSSRKPPPLPQAMPHKSTEKSPTSSLPEPREPTSPLPPALIIGALVMAQALIVFFCLFK